MTVNGSGRKSITDSSTVTAVLRRRCSRTPVTCLCRLFFLAALDFFSIPQSALASELSLFGWEPIKDAVTYRGTIGDGHNAVQFETSDTTVILPSGSKIMAKAIGPHGPLSSVVTVTETAISKQTPPSQIVSGPEHTSESSETRPTPEPPVVIQKPKRKFVPYTSFAGSIGLELGRETLSFDSTSSYSTTATILGTTFSLNATYHGKPTICGTRLVGSIHNFRLTPAATAGEESEDEALTRTNVDWLFFYSQWVFGKFRIIPEFGAHFEKGPVLRAGSNGVEEYYESSSWRPEISLITTYSLDSVQLLTMNLESSVFSSAGINTELGVQWNYRFAKQTNLGLGLNYRTATLQADANCPQGSACPATGSTKSVVMAAGLNIAVKF